MTSENTFHAGPHQQPRVEDHLWEFARQRDELLEAAIQLGHFLEEILEIAGAPFYMVESRAKSIESYRRKSERVDEAGIAKYQSPQNEIDDCVAARVIVFSEHARQAASEQVRLAFTCSEDTNPGEKKRNGYDSQHFVVNEILDAELRSRYKRLSWCLETRPGVEIQIRTVAGHAWAEYEHDVRYKPSGYLDLTPEQRLHVDQLFTEAGGLRRYMDETFNSIEGVLASQSGPEVDINSEIEQRSEADGVTVDETSLTAFLSSRFPDDSISDRELSTTIEHLRKLPIDTIENLERILDQGDPQHVQTLMDYRAKPGAVRRLDDELLAVLGHRYIASIPDGQKERGLQLEARFRRVGGKTLIYSLAGVPKLEGRYHSAAGMVRELVRQVAEGSGLESAEIEGASSTSNSLEASTRSKPIETTMGRIWVNTNMTRAGAEIFMRQLLEKIPDVDVTVFKAGDEIGRSPHHAHPAASST